MRMTVSADLPFDIRERQAVGAEFYVDVYEVLMNGPKSTEQ